jgi:hypothetical protein
LRNSAEILPTHTGELIKKPKIGIFANKKQENAKTTQSTMFPNGQ